jgi:hypothetical protein
MKCGPPANYTQRIFASEQRVGVALPQKSFEIGTDSSPQSGEMFIATRLLSNRKKTEKDVRFL